jgi:dTDP-4-dehydrorhamnose 3,5-epimerase-like enzyme
MGVGLKGVPLTSHIYPYTQSMVPYSGDKEFCRRGDDPGLGIDWPSVTPSSSGSAR